MKRFLDRTRWVVVRRVGLVALLALVANQTSAQSAMAQSTPEQGRSPSSVAVITSPEGSVGRARKGKTQTPLGLGLAVGIRSNIIRNNGFQAYSADGNLNQASVAISYVFYRVHQFSAAAVAGWDTGNSDSTVRQDLSSLTLHRFSLDIEGRYAFNPWFYAFIKGAPGALWMRGSLTDPAVEVPLMARSWTWSADATAGGAFAVLNLADERIPIRIWVIAEGGYGFTGAHAMVYEPLIDPNDPRHFGRIELPALQPSGPLGHLSVALTF